MSDGGYAILLLSWQVKVAGAATSASGVQISGEREIYLFKLFCHKVVQTTRGKLPTFLEGRKRAGFRQKCFCFALRIRKVWCFSPALCFENRLDSGIRENGQRQGLASSGVTGIAVWGVLVWG